MTQRMTSFRKLGAWAIIATAVFTSNCASAAVVSSPPPPLPGDLSISINTITSAQLAAKAESLSFDDGPLQPRDCGGIPCSARISAVKGQSAGPNTIGANGTIVARMVAVAGQGAAVEAKYGLRPGRANAYYLIAIRGATPGTWSWTLRHVVNDGNPVPPQEIRSGNWVTCSHTPPHPQVLSMFWSCSGTGMNGNSTLQLQDPGWLTCPAGCCTAGS